MSELVNSKPQNEATPKELRTRSSFVLDYDFASTMRFAEYSPHFVMEGVDNDRLPLHCSHQIKSYTLKAPLMSDITINKDYFLVPMQAILPLNWNKFEENPVIGEDVPADCGPSVADFYTKIGVLGHNSRKYLSTILSTGASSSVSAAASLDAIFKYLVFFERIYSDGSLLANLGVHASRFFSTYRTMGDREVISYDEYFDACIAELKGVDGPTAGVNYFVVNYGSDSSRQFYVEMNSNTVPVQFSSMMIGLRDFLELLRDDFTWTISAVYIYGASSETDKKNALIAFWSDFVSKFYHGSDAVTAPFYTASSLPEADRPALDLRRLWAYQIVCAHYYTNDKVDYVYSADLFRQYINQLVTGGPYAASTNYCFTVNGLQYQYDSLSAFYLNRLFVNFNSSGIFGFADSASTLPSLDEVYAYFRALFGFNRSLRFKDYFSGSNTRPLAVGDVNVQVNSSMVNVIDVTRNIQKQRFLNAINRIPHQIEDYLEGLFGKRPAPDYHNPFFLARTTDKVFGEENEYTGNVRDAEQNNITSVLRSAASRYAFEVSPDRSDVIIGITSFDIPRFYSQSIERQTMHYDRFDAFNPYMQFIGDQPIYQSELGSAVPSKLPFGYTLRHMEYKQRYNQCAGGFRKFLPGWLFISDTDRRVRTTLNQGPDFIRSHNTELDEFFLSLTGYSLGSYFHFIVRNSNNMTASRPMAYAPSIL